MAHEWSYSKSSVKHQPQQTKGLHALKILDQLSCLGLEQKFSSTLPHNFVWKGFFYLQFEVNSSSFYAADPIHINSFQIFSLEI